MANKTNQTNTTLVIGVKIDSQAMTQALALSSKNYTSISSNYQRAIAAGTFRNIDTPNVSVRDGFNRADCDYFRPGERLPTETKLIQTACRDAYKRFGIVRNM